MSDIEKDKMVAALKKLNEQIKTAEGMELERLLRNRGYIYQVILKQLGLTQMSMLGLLDDFKTL